ncbi:dicarboxylate/amino acid:cation symporter [Tissierellaceae bacterium HCP3S3_D8]
MTNTLDRKSVLKAYRFPLILISGIIIGCIIGFIFGENAKILKPLGDIFLNLIFAIVVPVVFFSISSAVASMSNMRRLGKILGYMLLLFVITGIISSIIMSLAVQVIKPAEGTDFPLDESATVEKLSFSEQVVSSITVPDFVDLLSRQNMLPLIVFSILFGFVVSTFGERAKPLVDLLTLISDVIMRYVNFIMYYAPIGLGAYFAYLIGDMGPQLLGTYARTMLLLYYPLCLLYFIFGFAGYAYFAGGIQGVKVFFKNILPVAATSLGTQSSIASLPINLQANKNMGVPKDIREIVLPIGATVHMDGSVFSAILKISLMYGLFGREFTGIGTWIIATVVAILNGMVMSAVPGGGLIGEVLIMNLYGFSMEAFPIIATVGFLVDPPATMINCTGDSVVSMMVARLIEGKDWMEKDLTANEDEGVLDIG